MHLFFHFNYIAVNMCASGLKHMISEPLRHGLKAGASPGLWPTGEG